MDFTSLKPNWSLGARSKSQSAIELLRKRKMVRFFGNQPENGKDVKAKAGKD